MAEFLCKNCGVTLQCGTAEKKIVCPHCGAGQMIPSAEEEVRPINISKNTVKEPLLRRAFLFLEDGDWASANTYCDRVLDENPENATAYLGKLMASRRAKSLGDLGNDKTPLEEDNNYHKILRFGDPALGDALKGYNDITREKSDAKKKKVRKRFRLSVASFLAVVLIVVLVINLLPSKNSKEEKPRSIVDVVPLSAGGSHTVGVKKDGTVVATGDNYYGQCDVEDWKDIVAVYAGSGRTIGLKKDGTVVATGYNDYGQCNVEDWEDIGVRKGLRG